MKQIQALSLLVLLPFMVSAEMDDKIKVVCETQESPTDIIRCYENAQNKIFAEQGKWIIARRAIFFHSDLWAKLMEASGQGIYLGVMCNTDKKASLLIDWRQPVTHKQTIEVIYKTDKEAAIASNWSVSKDHTMTSSQDTQSVLQKLMNSSQLTAYITTTAGKNLMAVFNTHQAGTALAEMKRCNR